MTKQTAQRLKTRRNSYIRRIQQDILEDYPTATFDVYRGPGHREATIRVDAPMKDCLDYLDSIGNTLGDAVEDNFHFLVLPSWPED